MENELRFYLNAIKDVMSRDTEPFKPQYLITAVRLDTGAIELAINNDHIAEKIDYILDRYDEEMCLKANPAIRMEQIMVV